MTARTILRHFPSPSHRDVFTPFSLHKLSIFTARSLRQLSSFRFFLFSFFFTWQPAGHICGTRLINSIGKVVNSICTWPFVLIPRISWERRERVFPECSIETNAMLVHGHVVARICLFAAQTKNVLHAAAPRHYSISLLFHLGWHVRFVSISSYRSVCSYARSTTASSDTPWPASTSDPLFGIQTFHISRLATARDAPFVPVEDRFMVPFPRIVDLAERARRNVFDRLNRRANGTRVMRIKKGGTIPTEGNDFSRDETVPFQKCHSQNIPRIFESFSLFNFSLSVLSFRFFFAFPCRVHLLTFAFSSHSVSARGCKERLRRLSRRETRANR